MRVMSERGIDLSGSTTKHLDRFVRARFDRPEFPGAPVTAHWSMADPAVAAANDEDSYPAFVRAADEIEVRVNLLIAELAHSPDGERSVHVIR